MVGRKKGKREEARTMRRREGWGCILSFGTARAAVGARMAKLLHGSSKCAQAARPAGVIAAHSAQTIRGGGLVHFYACQRTLCRAFDVCVRFWGVVVRARGATRQQKRNKKPRALPCAPPRVSLLHTGIARAHARRQVPKTRGKQRSPPPGPNRRRPSHIHRARRQGDRTIRLRARRQRPRVPPRSFLPHTGSGRPLSKCRSSQAPG